jgi:hypothetical protein
MPVSRLPITLRAWSDDPAAGDAAKKPPPPKDKAPETADGPPIESIVLLCEGFDLEADVTPPATEAEPEDSMVGDTGVDSGGGVPPPDLPGLVHLRDASGGRRLRLSDYGLRDGSLLYVVIEGRPTG